MYVWTLNNLNGGGGLFTPCPLPNQKKKNNNWGIILLGLYATTCFTAVASHDLTFNFKHQYYTISPGFQFRILKLVSNHKKKKKISKLWNILWSLALISLAMTHHSCSFFLLCHLVFVSKVQTWDIKFSAWWMVHVQHTLYKYIFLLEW